MAQFYFNISSFFFSNSSSLIKPLLYRALYCSKVLSLSTVSVETKELDFWYPLSGLLFEYGWPFLYSIVWERSSSFNFKNLIPAVILIVINENIAQIIACFRVVIFAANEPKTISMKLETKIKTTKPINISKITSSITNSPNVLAIIKII